MDEGSNVTIALEIEKLRGTLGELFARLEGRLDGMAQRTTEAEKDIEKADRATAERFGEVNRRLTSIERKVWLAAGAAAVAGGGSVAGLWSLVH